ncbi:MAG: DUF4468 domain-containing protein [Spirochaetes bacterium]|nr:DUF4468 domain-containing protein [Spirochaetota bacterium]
MKFLCPAVAVIVALSGCGRLIKVPEQERVIRQVFEVSSTKSEIYDRALEWCAKKLATVNDSIIVKDRGKGKIIGRGTGKYSEYFNFLVDREFSYNITIETKDNRFRVTFDNFIVYYDERQLKSTTAEFKFEIDKIRGKLEPLMENLRDYVSRGVKKNEDKKEEKEEDW